MADKEVGRPTTCTPEMCMKARDYLVGYKTLPDPELVPTIEGLSLFIDVSRSTIRSWIDNPTDCAEFVKIYERLMSLQGNALVNKGLGGVFNSSISKLMMSKHDYIEKTESSTHVKTETVDAKDQAKLDALLNGTQSDGSAKQTSDGGNAEGNKSAAKVPGK